MTSIRRSPRLPRLALPAPLAAALVGALALLLAQAPVARAVERKYETIVALGAAVPLASTEGVWTAIVHLDHESKGHYGDGTLNVLLDTATLTAGMTHPLGSAWSAGYAARWVKVVEGYGDDIYSVGRHLDGDTFEGDSLAGILSLAVGRDGPWQAAVEAEASAAKFRTARDTAPDYTLPPDFHQQAARLRLRYEAAGPENAPDDAPEPFRAELTLGAGRRTGWRAWTLGPHPGRTERFGRHTLAVRAAASPTAHQVTSAHLHLLTGTGLDFFSGYRIGGLAGEYAVAGYFRSEFRARRAAVLNLAHEFAFAVDRRLTLLVDGAVLEPLEMGPATDPAARRTMVGVGVGYRHGLRSLGGLPVIVRYGEGLRVPEGSPEGHRREVLLVVAAAW